MTDPPQPPVRRLVLVRHARAASAAATPGGSDRDRSLTDRGRSDAAAAGGWLNPRVDRVDEVWASSAVRARQTAEEILSRLTEAPRPDYRAALYDAGLGDLLRAVRDAADGTRTLVVVGHNPTVERLHLRLTGDERGFPPGAAAIIEVSGRWADLASGGGRLVDFFAP